MMQPIFTAAKTAPRRVAYAEGEEERVLRAVQVVVDEGLARPTLIGRPAVIEQRVEKFGLRLKQGATTTWSTSSRTSATATSGAPTTADRAQGRDGAGGEGSRCGAA